MLPFGKQQENLTILDRTFNDISRSTVGRPTSQLVGLPFGIVVNGASDVFVLNDDPLGVVKIPADGSGAVVLNTPGLSTPQGIAIDPNGSV